MTNDTACEYLAENVQRLLNERGWKQIDLVNRSNESPMAVNRIVHGSHLPMLATVVNIAQALGVSVDHLVAKPPKKNSKKAS